MSVSKNPAQPISKDYTWDQGESLVNFPAEGAGTEQLSSAMEGINKFLIANQDNLNLPISITPELQTHIQQIADSRGISLAEAESSFHRLGFLIGEGDIHLSESTRGYGSTSQLRFGHVVGNALDVDPAFASLLSPTGGLTGPGGLSANIDGQGILEEAAEGIINRIGTEVNAIADEVETVGDVIAESVPDFVPGVVSEVISGTSEAVGNAGEAGGTFLENISNEALSYHSPTHDGFGFLQKHFEVGPGYCYVEGECLKGTESPLSGQVSGISFWENRPTTESLEDRLEILQQQRDTSNALNTEELQEEINELTNLIEARKPDKENTREEALEEQGITREELLEHRLEELIHQRDASNALNAAELQEEIDAINEELGNTARGDSRFEDDFNLGENEVSDAEVDEIAKELEININLLFDKLSQFSNSVKTI